MPMWSLTEEKIDELIKQMLATPNGLDAWNTWDDEEAKKVELDFSSFENFPILDIWVLWVDN